MFKFHGWDLGSGNFQVAKAQNIKYTTTVSKNSHQWLWNPISCFVLFLFLSSNVSFLTFFLFQIFHQICGFNATFILSNTGKKAESLCIFIAACLQSLVTLFASHLVDKVGRKVLLEISSVITSISLLSLGFYFWSRPWSMEDSYYLRWVLLISLMTYFAAFSIGLGPVPWLILPEILTPQIKALGIGIAVGTNWLCFSLLSFLYQSLQAISDLSFIFWAMATVSFIAFIFTAFILIETKGKSLQEIQDKLIGLQLNRVDVAKWLSLMGERNKFNFSSRYLTLTMNTWTMIDTSDS